MKLKRFMNIEGFMNLERFVKLQRIMNHERFVNLKCFIYHIQATILLGTTQPEPVCFATGRRSNARIRTSTGMTCELTTVL